MCRHFAQRSKLSHSRKIFGQQVIGRLTIIIELLHRHIIKREQFGGQIWLFDRPLRTNFPEGLRMPQCLHALQNTIQRTLALSQPHFTAARCSRRR